MHSVCFWLLSLSMGKPYQGVLFHNRAKCSGMTVLIIPQVVFRQNRLVLGLCYILHGLLCFPECNFPTFIENVNRTEINAGLICGLIFECSIQSVLADKTAVPHFPCFDSQTRFSFKEIY